MKLASRHAFTLIEMLTVMLVIAIIAGLVMSTAGFVNRKAAKERANTEIQGFITALEAYKNENGGYPSTKETEDLDPKKHGSATSGKYKDASLALYKALSNDTDLDGKPDAKSYFEFKPNQLSGDKVDGKMTLVKYIQDPFGNSYAYSTAGADAEEKYQGKLRTDPGEERESNAPGFNPTFDIWSTAGSVVADAAPTEEDRKKWIKNW